MDTHPLVFVFPFVMLCAATMDVLTMRIANSVSIGLVATFFIIAAIAGMPVQQMLVHLGVGALVLIANMALFHLRLVGGGDAKLISAAAVWIGYEQLVPYVTYVTIFGGALALALLAYRRSPAGGLPLPAWASRLHDPKEGMPYGVAIAAGALVVYPMTSLAQLLSA